MPLYDYRCGTCGREVEVMHGIHDTGPEACEACDGAMTKVLSPPAIHFKGSGWAKKDAAAKRTKPKAAKSSGETQKASGEKPAEGASADKAPATPSATSDKPSSAGKDD